MTTSSITKYRAQGAIILERLSGMTIPVGLEPHIVSFKRLIATTKPPPWSPTRPAKARSRARRAGEADGTFDTGINVLADKLVGAGLGARKNPFEGYSKYAPSRLTDLPYAEEPKAIRALGAALAKKKPPTDVAKALAKSLRDAAGLEGR